MGFWKTFIPNARPPQPAWKSGLPNHILEDEEISQPARRVTRVTIVTAVASNQSNQQPKQQDKEAERAGHMGE